MPIIREVSPTGLVVNRDLFFDGITDPGAAVVGVTVLRSKVFSFASYPVGSIYDIPVFDIATEVKPLIILAAFLQIDLTSSDADILMSMGTAADPDRILLPITVSSGDSGVYGLANNHYGAGFNPGTATFRWGVLGDSGLANPGTFPSIGSDTIQIQLTATVPTSYSGTFQGFLLGFPIYPTQGL